MTYTTETLTPSERIIIFHRLIHKATDMHLYDAARLYCTEIINEISLLEHSIIEYNETPGKMNNLRR